MSQPRVTTTDRPESSPTEVTLEALRLYPVSHVAQLAGCCVETIRRRIRRGELPARRLGKGWGIPHTEAVRLLTGN